jgi:hypothetical protein
MIQTIRQLRDRDGDVFDHADDIGKLQADELNLLILDCCKNVVRSAGHSLFLGAGAGDWGWE